jgi:hypothetical protein
MRRSIFNCLVIVSWVVVSICGYSQTAPAADANPATVQPYELKGDRLGMSLAEFKARHYRKVGKKGHAPFCSDEGAAEVQKTRPPFVDCALFARYEVPDSLDRLPSYMTVANLNPWSYLFKFYEGQLFEIEVAFITLGPPEDLMSTYRRLYDALISTYGPPTTSEKRLRKNRYNEDFEIVLPTWQNGVSTRQLLWYGQEVDLIITHDVLYRRANQESYPNAPDL